MASDVQHASPFITNLQHSTSSHPILCRPKEDKSTNPPIPILIFCAGPHPISMRIVVVFGGSESQSSRQRSSGHRILFPSCHFVPLVPNRSKTKVIHFSSCVHPYALFSNSACSPLHPPYPLSFLYLHFFPYPPLPSPV